MTPFEAALLGLVQGLTEFLPVSSSGHLAIGEALLGVEAGDVSFEIIVHFGTLLAVVTAFRGRLSTLVMGCLKGESEAWRMVLLLGVGTVPAVVVGLLMKDALEATFASPLAVSGFLVATGVILWSTRFAGGERVQIGFLDALLIGMAQSLAVLPGISRSGSTICAGLWRGLDSQEAATFSFLLSIPVILGATILQVSEMMAAPPDANEMWGLVIGALVAYVSGVFAIRWLLGILSGGKLARFAYYCWAVGLIGVIYFWG